MGPLPNGHFFYGANKWEVILTTYPSHGMISSKHLMDYSGSGDRWVGIFFSPSNEGIDFTLVT